MKKKGTLLFIMFLLIIVWINLAYATQTYLNESYQWEQNLTKVDLSALTFGDIDNDGDLDLVLSGEISGAGTISKVYLNNETSLVENSQWQQNLTNIKYGSLTFVDIDNDGDLDLALSGCSSGGGYVASCDTSAIKTFIYLNNGTSLVESTQWQQNLTFVWRSALTFGDIDNNGKLDLILTGDTGSSYISKIYLNNGTSLVESQQWQSNLTGIAKSSVVVGDTDNDGDLDLIISGRDINSNKLTKLYINNGTTLTESSQWQQNLVSVDDSSLALADFDNDGDLDLSLTGCCDIHRVYRNNGTTFIEIQRELVDLGGIFAGSQAFGDYDNDGDLDLITNGREEYTTLYLYNVSNTNFTLNTKDPESIVEDLIYSSLAWIDLDNDADLDLIETGFGDNEVRAYVYTSNRSLTKNNTKPNPPNSSFSATYANNILMLSWGNGSDIETNTSGLYYNLMVGNSTKNNSIVSGVYGGSSNPTAGYFGNMMQRRSIALNVQLEANKTYYWYVQTIDTGLAKSNWSALQTFNTSLDVSKPNITINYPSPNASLHTTTPFFIFNATVTDANLTNVTLYANWTGSWHVNQSNSSGINGTYTFTINLTNNADGHYAWYIGANDSSNNSETSGIRDFYLDRAYPLVYLVSPANGNTWTSSSTVTFTYNVSDVDIANCSLIINNAIDQTDTTITEDAAQTFTKTLSNAVYNWNINCTDYVGYTNSSATYSLTVSYTAPSDGNGGSPGGGGGTSGGGAVTVTPTPEVKKFDIDFSTEITGTLEAKQGDVKTFTFQGEIKHSITTLTITSNSVTLLITSDPITIQINLGETKQIDINGDGINDLEINLISIVSGKAKFILIKLEGAKIVAEEELEKEIKKEALFDVKVSIENLFQVIKSGRDVIANIEVLNVNNIGQVDVKVEYYITSKEDNQTKIAEGSDTLAVEAVASFVRSLNVPYNIKSGIYYFNVNVEYKDVIMASGHAEFRVIRNYEIIIAVGIITLIIIGIFFYLRKIKKREEKDIRALKKEIGKLKRESLKEKWKRWRNKRKMRKSKKWQ